jgi:hypothetical protein
MNGLDVERNLNHSPEGVKTAPAEKTKINTKLRSSY